ncbi:uncharacterized protein [Phaseolus vulgaris]|uniref:uncharacterized protein n=1 Tax=Phaseolus vulgaris TaxID=3885 RepID=UPI0035CC3230
MEVMDMLHETGCIPKGCNASFIALVPKVRNPVHFDHYRPISLVGAMYKILSKVLAGRIKKVLPTIINDCQSAFLKDRGILDSVLMANEVVEDLRKGGRSGLCLKVDFEKAYDSVRWEILYDMLHKMGFHNMWIRWIRGCMESATVSVLVNGSPTEEFKPQRGLRQGDPLALFLFLVVVEGLTGLVRQTVRPTSYQMEVPFKYLGLEVGGNPRRKKFWEPVINKLKARLSVWKGRFLSMAGRICVIKSVLTAVPLYYLSLFRAPNSNQGQRVEEVGAWEGLVWRWTLSWRRDRFEWEKELETELVTHISSVCVNKEQSDVRVWGNDENGCFTVKSAYLCLASTDGGRQSEVFKYLWKARAFPNVLTTIWRALLDRLPTRECLSRRGVMLESTTCVLCHDKIESSQHLFMECDLALRANNKQSSVWKGIWEHRNSVVFKQSAVDAEEVFQKAQLKSWLWMKHKGGMVMCVIFVLGNLAERYLLVVPFVVATRLVMNSEDNLV